MCLNAKHKFYIPVLNPYFSVFKKPQYHIQYAIFYIATMRQSRIPKISRLYPNAGLILGLHPGASN